MDFRSLISREKIMAALQSLSSLRVTVSRSTLLTVAAVTLIFFVAFSIRMFPIRWGLELSEFDPYVQFRLTEHIVKNGYFDWITDVDTQRWYPLGAEFSRVYPGVPLTAATLYNVLSVLGVPISLYHFSVIFPALFGALACLVAFFLGNDVGGKTVGLFSAFFLALNSSYITRTSAGFFDDETVGIFAILLFAFLFFRALDKERPKRDSVIYALAAGLTLGYLSASWGAALYPISMTALFTLILVLIRRYSRRLLVSYSITFGLGLFLAVNAPRPSIKFLASGGVVPAAAVFCLLCLIEALNVIHTRKWKIGLAVIVLSTVVGGFIVLSYFGYAGSLGAKFLRVINPLLRGESQIFQSVQEHRLTAWGSLYYDYGVGVLFFALGMFFAIRDLTNRNLFILIFGLTSLYFAMSMVRLTVLLAPSFSILMAVGIVNLMRPFVTLMKASPKIPSGKKYVPGRVGKEFSGSVLIILFLLLTFTYAFPSPRMYGHAYSPPTILAASVPIKPGEAITEWTEALSWMNLNLPDEAIVCSWWDYGYWITVKGNRTSLADNGTFNSTHIGLIGKVFMSNETEAVKILREHFTGPDGPPTHILVFTTFNSLGSDQGYGDEGKWRWMARIANQTVTPGLYYEWGDRDQYNTFGNLTENRWSWNEKGRDSTIYKLMQVGKNSLVPSVTVPDLRYFEISHFSPGRPVASLGQSGGQTVFLYALVCLYEVDYQQYDLDYPSG